MSYNAGQLAKLKEMYAKGVLTLEQGGEKVSFASGDELRTRIQHLEAEIAAQGQAPETTVTYPEFSKGHD